MNFELVNKTVVLTGKRNSGKSLLLRHIVKKYKDEFQSIFVICPTEIVADFYGKFIEPKNIFYEYKEEWVEQLIKTMTEKTRNEGGTVNVLLILDDVGSEDNFKKSKNLERLFTRGRHIKVALIMTTQYLYMIPPVVRSNADYILVGQQNGASVEILSDEYRNPILSRKEFIQLYLKNSTDHNFFIINNNSIKDLDDINLLYGRIKVPENEL